MAKRNLWKLPELNAGEEQGEHRKVTWLDLFFDLFFVVSIAQLAHTLSAHPSWKGIVDFALMFIPIWWIWIGYTYYNERFESTGLEYRLFTFLSMLPVIGFAFFGHHGIEKGFSGFAVTYAAARVLLTILWLRAALHVPAFRPTGFRFVIGFTLSAVIALTAAFINTPLGYWFFAFALTIDLLTPLTTVVHQAKLPRFSTSKLPERFGLFVIIVLGEMVVGVVNGLTGEPKLTTQLFLQGTLGVTLGFSLWWIYFDCIGHRSAKNGTGWGFSWGYLHLPLVMAIVATGAGIANIIGIQEGELALDVQQLVSGSVGTYLVVTAFLEMTLRKEKEDSFHNYASPLLKLITGMLAFTVGWKGGITDPVILLLVLIGLLVFPMGYGVWTWTRQEN